MIMQSDKSAIWAYVYLVYYYDPSISGIFERMRSVDPIPVTTFANAMRLIEGKTHDPIIEITPSRRWRIGNYWIDRQEILDIGDAGIEREDHANGGRKAIAPLMIRED